MTRQLILNLMLIARLALLASGSAWASDVPEAERQIREPETELALIKTDLDNWLLKLNAGGNLNSKLGIGPQNAAAERAWTHACEFFSQKEWTSAIRELNNYLNQSQVPHAATFQKAQYMLGIAYESLQYKEKAVRAYFRYLAGSLTAKEQDHEELIDVLRRMIPIASSVGNKKELRQILASLTSLDLPQDVQPLAYYYVGKAAFGVGDYLIASQWFEKAIAAKDDPVVRAKSLYMQGTIAVEQKDYEKAEEFFGQTVVVSKDDGTKDLARLALARLALRQRKLESSVKFYDSVDMNAPAFKDAIFESIYVLLELKQEAEARAKSLIYLSRWPEGPDSVQIRMLLAYLDMRAGDLKAARESIVQADKRLNDINAWLQRNLANQTLISQTTLDDLQTVTGAQLPIPKPVRVATEMYVRLAEMSRRLSDVRGLVRNTLFTIGRGQLAQLKPFWVNRSEQLELSAEELLKIGHRLVETERRLYSAKMSPLDKQRLEASFQRRASLLSSTAASRRRAVNWENFTSFAKLNQRVAKIAEKAQLIQAELVATRFIAEQKSKGDGKESSLSRLSELSGKTERLVEYTARGLEAVRRNRVGDLVNESPHRMVMSLFKSYASALVDEELVLARLRDNGKSTAERLNAEDAAAAWAQWRFLAGTLFEQLASLDKDIAGGLAGMISELDLQEHRHEELQAKVGSLNMMLAEHLGQTMSSIIREYMKALNERFARNQKWQGDIDYLTYLKNRESTQKAQEQLILEQQILRDNLMGLQQGVLWQWPN